MEKTVINGVEFCNFGDNNYSDGMELITCYPMPENIVQDVLDGKYPGVYLNPSAPCGEEFYGVLGTEEQYKEFYRHQRGSQVAKASINKLGGTKALYDKTIPVEKWEAAEAEAEKEYKDWWNK